MALMNGGHSSGIFSNFLFEKGEPMSIIEIIKAWKDEGYRENLLPDDVEKLPENPAGLIDLEDLDLIASNGGTATGLCCYSPGGATSGGGSSG